MIITTESKQFPLSCSFQNRSPSGERFDTQIFTILFFASPFSHHVFSRPVFLTTLFSQGFPRPLSLIAIPSSRFSFLSHFLRQIFTLTPSKQLPNLPFLKPRDLVQPVAPSQFLQWHYFPPLTHLPRKLQKFSHP